MVATPPPVDPSDGFPPDGGPHSSWSTGPDPVVAGPIVAGPVVGGSVFGRRMLAWFLDLALFVAVVAGTYAALAEYTLAGTLGDLACDLLQQSDPDRVDACLVVGDRAYFLSAADVGLQSLVSFGYLVFFIVMQGLVGASPGKLLMGLRVVRDDGRRAGVGRSLARTLAWAVDGAPWFAPLVGGIVGLTTVGHRRIGDFAAGTWVVSRSQVGVPVQPGVAAPPPSGQQAWGAASPADGSPSTGPTNAVPPRAGPPATFPYVPPPGAASPAPPAPEHAPDAAPRTTADPDPTPHATPPPLPADDHPQPPVERAAPPIIHELPPPQWDPARNTYLQWDPNRRMWLQWNAADSRWDPINS